MTIFQGHIGPPTAQESPWPWRAPSHIPHSSFPKPLSLSSPSSSMFLSLSTAHDLVCHKYFITQIVALGHGLSLTFLLPIFKLLSVSCWSLPFSSLWVSFLLKTSFPSYSLCPRMPCLSLSYHSALRVMK